MAIINSPLRSIVLLVTGSWLDFQYQELILFSQMDLKHNYTAVVYSWDLSDIIVHLRISCHYTHRSDSHDWQMNRPMGCVFSLAVCIAHTRKLSELVFRKKGSWLILLLFGQERWIWIWIDVTAAIRFLSTPSKHLLYHIIPIILHISLLHSILTFKTRNCLFLSTS